jgi:asparagine synthase (glutamine-hydrolysing)
MMSRINDRPVKTNTVGFQEKKFDESGFGREVSEFLRTDHHERLVTPENIETIEKLAWHFDEPFSDPSALPTYYVSQVAREKVTVALSGDGGDENFAGYSHYLRNLQQNRIRSVMPDSARRLVFAPLGKLYPKMDWAPRALRAKSTLQDLSFDAIDGYVESMSTFRNDEKQSILSPDLKGSLGDYDTSGQFREYDRASGIGDPLSRLQYLDIKTYLTDDILVKVDRTSMANSLEVRCPLLDHKLMELVATMPSSLKLKGSTGKYIFKRAIEGYLPKQIIYRQKMGFGIPMREWFRNGIRDFARAQLLDVQDPYLSNPAVAKIWKEHQSGIRDRSWQLWNVLMFRLWYGLRSKNGH